jgi:hypothetical protein
MPIRSATDGRYNQTVYPCCCVQAGIITSRNDRMVLLVIPTVFTVLPAITATAVSRAISTKPMSRHSVQDLQSYLFRAFLGRVNKRHKRDLSMAAGLQIDALASHNSVDPRASLEQKILIDEFLMQCDPATRDMLWRRVFQNRWSAYIDCGDLQPPPPCGTGYAALVDFIAQRRAPCWMTGTSVATGARHVS